MTYYVPGLGEKDTDKAIRSLMQAHEKVAANEAAIATNTADIAAIEAAIAGPPWGTVTSVGSGVGLTGGPITSSGTLAVDLSKLTNSLSGDVALNNTANYFDGPSVAQGTSGTWFVSGGVTVQDTSAVAGFYAKLWDGTTVIDSRGFDTSATNFYGSIFLSGFITSPVGDIRISVRDASTTSGKIIFNRTGNSKDSSITAIRIA